MNAPTRSCLYDERQLEPVLDSMAARLTGLLASDEDLVLVGIRRRGVPLAAMLAEHLARRGLLRPALRLELVVKRYADDLSLLHPQTRLSEDTAPTVADLAGRCAIVVDDVLYRGHSLLRVVQHLVGCGAARVISTVLVDRGVSVLPIHADVAGLRLDVPTGSIVEVHVPPYEADFSIELVRPGD
ncbi:phosphoribosyltransferase family protein [Accumulibacter sp.]|uniref:phosphoribosyltransferase family protein n=1 Tax=Accumulibacter sp. TaxID=2053492 RepID=UPI0025F6CFC5|nr:phosphoribosyltransferase family protein [Accumulibacter sp.]MCM8611961.1 phosphoribosyltransferase [Accumulibacter sp.]MCM8635583.1 phosphoribosyltransferase [Accumulibacter sp.]MCM8639161.1 phosphoribosyltransferase [Accumulibacter sp.]